MIRVFYPNDLFFNLLNWVVCAEDLNLKYNYEEINAHTHALKAVV